MRDEAWLAVEIHSSHWIFNCTPLPISVGDAGPKRVVTWNEVGCGAEEEVGPAFHTPVLVETYHYEHWDCFFHWHNSLRDKPDRVYSPLPLEDLEDDKPPWDGRGRGVDRKIDGNTPRPITALPASPPATKKNPATTGADSV